MKILKFFSRRHKGNRIFIFKFLGFKTAYEYYQNYLKYSYKEVILYRYSDGKFYLDLLKKAATNKKINTDVSIEFFEKKKNKKEILDKYKKYEYKLVDVDLLGIDVLFFKQRIGPFKMKVEFHFYKQTLFLYRYIFSDVNKEKIDEILQIIKEKYSVKNELSVEYPFSIVDKYGNMIVLDYNKINFSLNYLSSDREVFERIKEKVKKMEISSKRKQKLYKKILYRKL